MAAGAARANAGVVHGPRRKSGGITMARFTGRRSRDVNCRFDGDPGILTAVTACTAGGNPGVIHHRPQEADRILVTRVASRPGSRDMGRRFAGTIVHGAVVTAGSASTGGYSVMVIRQQPETDVIAVGMTYIA